MSSTSTSTADPPVAAEAGALLRAAAIVDDGACDVDQLLAAVVQRQQGLGRRVRGVLMTYPDGDSSCAGRMVLVDIDTRQTYLASQALGSASGSCRVDPRGFAAAAQVLRRAADERPDLVVCNRFGGLEATGGGFRDELLQLLGQGLPLLTAVAPRHVDAWQAFTGGTELLPSDAQRVDAWLQACLDPPAAAA